MAASAFKIPTLALPRPQVAVSNSNTSSRSSSSYEDSECQKFGEEATQRLNRAGLGDCVYNRRHYPRVLGSGQYGVVFQVDDDRVVKHSSLLHRTMHTRCTPDTLPALQKRLQDGWNEPAAEQRFSRIVGEAFPNHVYRVHGARHCMADKPVAEMEIDRLMGQTLLSAFRALAPQELSDVFVQLLHVTAYASFRGVIHNDLHFGNIILVPHGGSMDLAGVGRSLPARQLANVRYRAVLIDYGLAQFADTRSAFVPTDTGFVVQQFFRERVPLGVVVSFLRMVPYMPQHDHILENGLQITASKWETFGSAIRDMVEAVIHAGGDINYSGPITPFTNSNTNSAVSEGGHRRRKTRRRRRRHRHLTRK